MFPGLNIKYYLGGTFEYCLKTISILISVFLLPFISNAQRMVGTISDSQGKPVSGASVIFYYAADSSIEKIITSDTSGKYNFAASKPGKYFADFSISGFKHFKTEVLFLGLKDVVSKNISLERSALKLKEIVIVSKKPMIEVKADKTVFNVEGSVNAVGSDVIELLAKSPGVVIDRDDNIVMNGKNGVNVYIDGRPSPLTGQALAVYLRSIPSSSVEAIELITNPSARYDASGNAGIINIRLKKNSSFGTNGSVNSGYAIGVYAKYVEGFSLNTRNKFMNLFGSYNFNKATNENSLFVTRSQSDTGFAQNSKTTNRITGHNFKAGADFYLNKRNTLGFITSGNVDRKNTTLYSETPIIYSPTQTIIRWLIADNRNKVRNKVINTNLNYRHTGKAGSELNLDADYGCYNLSSDQLQPNYYLDAGRTMEEKRSIFEMLAPSMIRIYSLKGDYEKEFPFGKLNAGLKFSYVNSDNKFNQYNVVGFDKYFDSARSNNFNYTENINAVYVNYNKQFKTILLQAGVRVENSNIKGRSSGFRKQLNTWVLYDSSFNLHYTDFFPSVAITFNKDDNNHWGITYSRRIDRPAYQDMNPFEIKIDEYSYFKGNTELRPQYSNSFGISHTYKGKLNTRLNYSIVKDVMSRLLDTTERVKSFLTRKNVASQHLISLNVNYTFQYDWYSLFANLNAFHSRYEADYGMGRTIDLSVNAFTINLQQTAKLQYGWTIELNGFYNSPSIWNGTFKSRENYGVDAGVQKKLFNEKINLKLSLSDVFHTQRWFGTSNFVGQRLDAEYRWESMQFKANLTWTFGNSKMNSTRQRKTATDEEGKRVQQNGNSLEN